MTNSTKKNDTMVCHIVKCNCGSFEAKVYGESFQAVICHCHSCVTCNRHITEDPESHDGVPLSMYQSKNVKFVKALDSSNLGFVKVGKQGKIPRVYCKNCKSHVMNLPAKGMVAFNRDCMYEEDGTTKHNPKETMININAASSFDPSKVPEPKHPSFGSRKALITKVAPVLIGNQFKRKDPFRSKYTELYPDPSTMEVAEITW